MPFTGEQRGFDEQGRRIRRILNGVGSDWEFNNILASLGTELAEMWRQNILDGPNERWEAGPSRRALRDHGTTLFDTGAMMRSITGAQTGPLEVTVGSTLTVGDRGYNLLALHEFGVDTVVVVDPFTRQQKSRNVGKSGKLGVSKKNAIASGIAAVNNPGDQLFPTRGVGFYRHQHLPRRPTSPFDWDAGTLLPKADALVRKRITDYTVELAR